MNTGQRVTLDHLPHRPPFLFLSEVRELDRHRRGEAVWRVTGGEDFLRGHFPTDAIVPGVLITEALAQLAGLVAFFGGGDADLSLSDGSPNASRKALPATLAHIDVRFDSAVRPPAEIHIRAETTRVFGRLWQFNVSASVASAVVARGRLTLAARSGEPNDAAVSSSC